MDYFEEAADGNVRKPFSWGVDLCSLSEKALGRIEVVLAASKTGLAESSVSEKEESLSRSESNEMSSLVHSL